MHIFHDFGSHFVVQLILILLRTLPVGAILGRLRTSTLDGTEFSNLIQIFLLLASYANYYFFLHIITSVLAAAIGVQSKQNHEKDFSAKNSIYIYLFSGIVFTLLFVLTVIFIVKTVLAGSI